MPDQQNREATPEEIAAYHQQFLDGRHPATVQLLRWFESDHLPAPLRTISVSCRTLAVDLVHELPDGPELTTGLRKLLEAKDCFVRAALSAQD